MRALPRSPYPLGTGLGGLHRPPGFRVAQLLTQPLDVGGALGVGWSVV